MKKVKEFLKCKELFFSVTVYPIMFFIFINMKNIFSEWVNKNPVYYSLIVFSCSVFMILYVLLEIITKIYNYELQGDKLKIRQQEGINIEELNNGR